MNSYSTICEAADALRSGETTAVALAEAAIAVADEHDEAVGTFLSRYNCEALKAAEAADAAFAAGIDKGPLQGIPLGIKDIITTAEGPSTAQSLVLDPQWGLDIGDAVVVSRLRDAGALIMGKLTTMEFAIGMPDFDRPFPIPRNPWNLDYWPGGSSSGSGSAVATGMVLGALGTDTGGSIRIPAAFCGVSGLMPTFGRVPKSGCAPLGYSLDHIGPLTRSARDAALILAAISGVDAGDPGSADVPVPDFLTGLTGDLTGLRIGVQRLEQFAAEEDPAMAAVFADAVDVLAAAGADVVEVQLPLYSEMTSAAFLLFAAEALAYHMPDMQSRWADYAPGTRKMIGMGFGLSAADYVQAQRARRVGQKALAHLFTKVDLVVTPTTSTVAPRMDHIASMMAEGLTSIHTPYWDTTGNPAMSIPMGFGDAGMPLALQIAARPFDEAMTLRVADAFQQRTTWHQRKPVLTHAPSLAGVN
ncbi:MAG TPA: amidase [Frankiaceae bacterium]|nr:amidase [Frankiaceae bacterium]